MSDFDWAQSVLDAEERPSLNHVAKALKVLADSSADVALRGRMQHVSFQQLLSLFSGLAASTEKETSNPSLWVNLLRCIGNMIADNDGRRSEFIQSQTYLKTLNSFLLSDSASKLTDTTVKVLYNLCTDYTPAQQECFKQNIHHSLIYLLDSRLPHDNSAVWGLALDVACMIVEHKQELRPSEEYSDAPRLLRLPLAHVDATTFLDALTLVAAHLLDKKFVQGLVESMQIHLVWDLLKRTEQRMHSDREQEDDQDYDEKQYLQFQLVLSQALADMTALPLYNDKYDSEHPFIQSLYSQTLPSSSPSPIAPAACLILGNLIQSDRDAYTLIPHVPIRNLFTHISRSNDAAFLNAACGLLRHLATPMENRERYFADPTYLTSTQHLYTNISLEQVQMAGLALTRQMLASMQSRLLSAILSHDNNTNINNNDNFLTTILSSYQSTTSTSVKFEVSRLAVSFLRTLQVSSSPSSSTTTIPSEEEEDVANLPSPHQTNLTKTAQEQLFDTPVNLPSILDPLIFTIKHTPEANMMAIQAEAWLGLNLAARLSGGAIKVGDAFSRDEDLFALYCLRLGGGGGGAISNDERPNWLVEKERDNAVLLGAELIKAGDVDEGVKRKFKTVLDERGIHVGAG